MSIIAVSILSHGAAAPTLMCARSLIAEAEASTGRFVLDVRVADNGSAEDHRRALRDGLAGLPGVTLHLHDQNLGFACGHNRNLERIFADSRPEYLWLLNNDCVVEPGCVDALLDCARKRREVGIWGATLLEADGDTIQCAGGCIYNGWLSTYRQSGRGRPVGERSNLKSKKLSYVSGASLFFPASTLKNGLLPPRRLRSDGSGNRRGLLNESFFLYFEELDLAQRLAPRLTMGWCRDALIIHVGGLSMGTGGKQRSARAEYHSTLSALKFTRLYYPLRLWLMAPARFLGKSAQLLFTGNIRLFRSLVAAYRDFWKWLHHGGL